MIPENRATSQRVRKSAKAIIHVLTSDVTTGLTHLRKPVSYSSGCRSSSRWPAARCTGQEGRRSGCAGAGDPDLGRWVRALGDGPET
jgi:hypothetical protein